MPSSFTMNTKHNDAFGAQVLAAGWMQELMLAQAEKVAARARATAPRDTNEFAESIEASVRIRHQPGPPWAGDGKAGRAVGTVTATSPGALWIELGTRDTPRHRTLGNALDAVGGEL